MFAGCLHCLRLLCGPGQPPAEAPKYTAWVQYFDGKRQCAAPTPPTCPNNCSGSGECSEDPLTGQPKCNCYYRFSGTACEHVDPLDYFDCG